MAGDWIKMRMDLQSHPKVVRMMSALKADKFRIIGGLHAVWCVFDAHSEDGLLLGYTLEAMDGVIGWPGFSEAMQTIEWLEETDFGLWMPAFERHNGASAKRRANDTVNKSRKRASVADDAGGQMSASHADKTRTREEKRREEEKPSAAACAHPPAHESEPGQNCTPTAIGEIAGTIRRHGIDANPGHPSVRKLAELGTPIETIEAACLEAKGQKAGERITAGLIAAICERWGKQAAGLTHAGHAPAPPPRASPGSRRASPEPDFATIDYGPGGAL